ncbi:MAG: glycogen/starch/alpha-glucan phosphorylase, partial [Clostridia bacterium]|nr:glycogen/starch/alpha-glucan phosphorylase [Clostridia bacterium]
MAKKEQKDIHTQGRIGKEELKKKIESKLSSRGITDPVMADKSQLYLATVSAIKDYISERRAHFKQREKAADAKKVCYLCMEFLVGRSLRTVSQGMGIYEALEEIYASYGKSFGEVYSAEVDPGLGNGGLGRLAACYMDALSAGDYSAVGYSLLYENGLFRQKLVDGEQVELPDLWLQDGGPWLYP